MSDTITGHNPGQWQFPTSFTEVDPVALDTEEMQQHNYIDAIAAPAAQETATPAPIREGDGVVAEAESYTREAAYGVNATDTGRNFTYPSQGQAVLNANHMVDAAFSNTPEARADRERMEHDARALELAHTFSELVAGAGHMRDHALKQGDYDLAA